MEQDFVSLTALDQMTSSDQDQFIKAALPFLAPRQQQVLSIYTKAKEFLNTAALFSGSSVQMQSAAPAVSDPLEICSEIRKFCYGQSKRQLDQIVNVYAMLQMMQVLQEDGPQNEEGNFAKKE